MNTTQDQSRTIGGMLLIGLGGLFLLGQVTGFGFFGFSWPLFVLIPGLIFLGLALKSEDNSTLGFIFPGMIVTGTGLILSYQNMTGHWESWAYIWTMYPVMVGLALRYVGNRTQHLETAQVGRMLMTGGLIGFVGLGALFELFIFGGAGMGIFVSIIPLVMIGAGLLMLFRTQTRGKAKRKSHDIL